MLLSAFVPFAYVDSPASKQCSRECGGSRTEREQYHRKWGQRKPDRRCIEESRGQKHDSTGARLTQVGNFVMSPDIADTYVPRPFTRNWAQGARLAFLQQSLQVYNKAALKSSRKAQDALDSIINNYFKQFNWRHPVSREPKPDDPPLDAPKAKLSAPEEKLKQQVIAKMKDVRLHFAFQHFETDFLTSLSVYQRLDAISSQQS